VVQRYLVFHANHDRVLVSTRDDRARVTGERAGGNHQGGEPRIRLRARTDDPTRGELAFAAQRSCGGAAEPAAREALFQGSPLFEHNPLSQR